jgi:hypothetical protein
VKGIYQHCSEKHLHGYLSEFDFRYSNRVRLGVDDVERTARAIQGAVGKRLTYRWAHHREAVWQKPKKPKTPKPSKKDQYEQFQQTARDLGVDDEKGAETFELAFRKIVPPKRPFRNSLSSL